MRFVYHLEGSSRLKGNMQTQNIILSHPRKAVQWLSKCSRIHTVRCDTDICHLLFFHAELKKISICLRIYLWLYWPKQNKTKQLNKNSVSNMGINTQKELVLKVVCSRKPMYTDRKNILQSSWHICTWGPGWWGTRITGAQQLDEAPSELDTGTCAMGPLLSSPGNQHKAAQPCQDHFWVQCLCHCQS